jgi:hypothetical protein
MCGLQRLEVSEDAQCALTTVWDRFMHWDRMFLALHNMSKGADTIPTTYRARPRGSLVSSAWCSLRAALSSLCVNLPCARPSFPVDMLSPGHIPSRSFPTASRRRRLVYTALDDDAASAAQLNDRMPRPRTRICAPSTLTRNVHEPVAHPEQSAAACRHRVQLGKRSFLPAGQCAPRVPSRSLLC